MWRKIACLILLPVAFFFVFSPPVSAQVKWDVGQHVYQPVTAYTTAQTVQLYYSSSTTYKFTEFSACNDDAAGGDSVWFDASGSAAIVALESPPPPTAALAGLGAGNVDVGAHIYKYTCVSGSYESYGGPASATVTTTAGDGQVSLTVIAACRTGTTARKVYRTAAGGSIYKLLTTINDNVTTTYTDNTADSGLGAILATNIAYTSVEIKPQECVAFGYPQTSTVSVITFANTAVVRIRGQR